jgi:hypothetical protein
LIGWPLGQFTASKFRLCRNTTLGASSAMPPEAVSPAMRTPLASTAGMRTARQPQRSCWTACLLAGDAREIQRGTRDRNSGDGGTAFSCDPGRERLGPRARISPSLGRTGAPNPGQITYRRHSCLSQTQFSTLTPGIRVNSRTLLVTMMNPSLRA